ncbi:MAG TPA: amidohydrolase family protein [Solirubrobacteraceae bacterium]|jgi:aminocarboxymuconate-semialdehyde decarboxylase|nr:amidohydrolase family protein [Solirubrobacteraceae bacterium]
MVIDVHAHAMLPGVEALLENDPRARQAREDEAAFLGPESAGPSREMVTRVAPLMLDLDARLAKMDAQGVDVQVISTSPAHYHAWAPRELAARLARAIGEEIAALCARSERLHGLGYAPLQHPDVAETAVVEAVHGLGLHGVEIPSSGGEHELGDPELEPFWAKAEETGALVFIHPWGCTLGTRLSRHFMSNLVGQPVENAMAISSLVLSGLLERRPGLRIVVAHGGGYLPFAPGRMDHGWEVRPELASAERPSDTLKRLYYDSLTFAPELLETLAGRVGADRILLGSDFPFDMGCKDPVGHVHAAKGLTEAEREAILGATAAALLGLDAHH